MRQDPPLWRKEPALNRSLLGRIGQALGHRAAGIRSGILTMAGLGLLTWGAFTYAFWAGLVMAGVGCFTLDWWLSPQSDGGERR